MRSCFPATVLRTLCSDSVLAEWRHFGVPVSSKDKRLSLVEVAGVVFMGPESQEAQGWNCMHGTVRVSARVWSKVSSGAGKYLLHKGSEVEGIWVEARMGMMPQAEDIQVGAQEFFSWITWGWTSEFASLCLLVSPGKHTLDLEDSQHSLLVTLLLLISCCLDTVCS